MGLNRRTMLVFWMYCLYQGVLLGQEDRCIGIAFLGTFHFSQLQDSTNELTDFFSERRKKETEEVVAKLKQYHPDQVYIEREPRFQNEIDSLYALYRNDKLKLEELENGSSEVFQLAFCLAKELKLDAPRCVNHYESTSQSLIVSGTHREKYQNALKSFQSLGRSVVGSFLKGEVSLWETLARMNSPENISLSHNLLFNIPAYVQEGEFASYDNIDPKTVDKRYIGAEFITLFYERNLKIYSNILNAQLKYNDRRILCITGQVHVGVLQDLLKKNDQFKVMEFHELLSTKN